MFEAFHKEHGDPVPSRPPGLTWMVAEYKGKVIGCLSYVEPSPGQIWVIDLYGTKKAAVMLGKWIRAKRAAEGKYLFGVIYPGNTKMNVTLEKLGFRNVGTLYVEEPK